MRGKDEQKLEVFSYVSPEQPVPQDHPLRPLRAMTDEALQQLRPRFEKLYAKIGRPSIAPEKLLRAPTGRLCICGPVRSSLCGTSPDNLHRFVASHPNRPQGLLALHR